MTHILNNMKLALLEKHGGAWTEDLDNELAYDIATYEPKIVAEIQRVCLDNSGKTHRHRWEDLGGVYTCDGMIQMAQKCVKCGRERLKP